MPVVWSERPEPNSAGLKDCTYSAGLQALVHGGKVAYALGIYTVAEREALERSDDQPNETGASLDDLIVAVKRRYGIEWTKSRVELLAQHHARVDLAFVIQGVNGNLPAGHPQRRFDPTYTGGHCVTIIPTGDGTHVKWLDPLAPNKFAGDTVLWTTVMKWIGNMPSQITVRKDAYAPPAPKVYTQAEMDAVNAKLTKALADLAVCRTEMGKANAALAVALAANVANGNAGYNSGLIAAQAAVSAVPRK
jgi:hypothetical protein